MVAREGGYYGAAFQGYRGVTQVDPLSSTIFNMMVYAVGETLGDGDVVGRGG